MNCKHMTAGGAVLFSALTLFANWTISETVDTMTDRRTHQITTPGTPVSFSEHASYTPTLAVYAGQSPSAVSFSIRSDGLRRGRSNVLVRFDDEPATNLTVTASPERRAGFFWNPAGFVSKLMSSTNLTVRYTTTLGHVRTTKFDTSGLADAIEKVKKITVIPIKNR